MLIHPVLQTITCLQAGILQVVQSHPLTQRGTGGGPASAGTTKASRVMAEEVKRGQAGRQSKTTETVGRMSEGPSSCKTIPPEVWLRETKADVCFGELVEKPTSQATQVALLFLTGLHASHSSHGI